MNRHDRKLWRSALTLADLGDLTAAWLNGHITQTPGHCGAPCAETIPHIEVLAAANRAGFVTTNSQSAVTEAEAAEHGWRGCEAWAAGFVSGEALERIQATIMGTPLLLAGARGRQRFGESPFSLRAAWRDETGFYADRCPSVNFRSVWLITITDPEPGRNDRLWPALADFAGLAVAL